MVRLGAGCVAALVIVGGAAPRVQPTRTAQHRTAPYAADPDHLWNRIGEYGLDTVDPLLWRETRHLLIGPSHAAAEAKSRTYEWGLLQGWWQSQPR